MGKEETIKRPSVKVVEQLKKDGNWWLSYVKVGGLLLVFLAIFLILKPFAVIDGGERGVVFNKISGVSPDVCDEGICWKIPIVEKVIKYETRTMKYEISTSAASKDLQVVTTQVALNFHLLEDKVNVIYQKVGVAIADRILNPAIQESVKASTAKYKAEDLIENREKVKEHIKEQLRDRLMDYNIVMDDLSITNFEFSEQFAKAIEMKAQAEQDALREKNYLEMVEYQAMQIEETARGEYKAMALKNKAIKENREILQLSAIEKWNGVLPVVMGGEDMPFIINTQDLTKQQTQQ